MKKGLTRLLLVGVVGMGMGGLPAGAAGSGSAVTPMTDSFWTEWHVIATTRSWEGRLSCRWQREYVQFSPQTGDYSVTQKQTTITRGEPCPSP
ncbi:hypothetical protein ACMT4L_05330 [Deinococcus sp. A31D244]|uniref:hypothetical protein n=1 Tax=Deinococcus sp. A31D244 TaxID=3397675 RepID=UPI0039DF832D